MTALDVYLVLGSGRNGSTLLGSMLGSVPGLVNVGELHWIWDRGIRENRTCGCGRPFNDCPQWTQVLRAMEAVPPTEGADRAAIRHASLEGLAPFRFGRRRWERAVSPEQRTYLELTGALYRAAAATAGVDGVVDTSKRPVYGLAITRIDGITVRVIHLVRDPRAVAFSWRRRKPNPDLPDGGLMRRHPAWKSALGWLVWNLWSERIGRRDPQRSIRVRYEDLMRDPGAFVAELGRFMERDLDAALTGPRSAAAAVSHSVSGNPSRFDTGSVELREDLEWVDEMGRVSRWLVTATTWPLMLRYGYPLRSSKVRRPR